MLSLVGRQQASGEAEYQSLWSLERRSRSYEDIVFERPEHIQFCTVFGSKDSPPYVQLNGFIMGRDEPVILCTLTRNPMQVRRLVQRGAIHSILAKKIRIYDAHDDRPPVTVVTSGHMRVFWSARAVASDGAGDGEDVPMRTDTLKLYPLSRRGLLAHLESMFADMSVKRAPSDDESDDSSEEERGGRSDEMPDLKRRRLRR